MHDKQAKGFRSWITTWHAMLTHRDSFCCHSLSQRTPISDNKMTYIQQFLQMLTNCLAFMSICRCDLWPLETKDLQEVGTTA